MTEVTDVTPDDCNHTKPLLTIDNDGELERVCPLCNDIETLTLDD